MSFMVTLQNGWMGAGRWPALEAITTKGARDLPTDLNIGVEEGGFLPGSPIAGLRQRGRCWQGMIAPPEGFG
jgi:hypothetical protein